MRVAPNLKAMNKSIIETIATKAHTLPPLAEAVFIDGYNRRLYADGLTIAITTRIDASNHFAVIVIEDE